MADVRFDKFFDSMANRLKKGISHAEIQRASYIAQGLQQELDPKQYTITQNRNQITVESVADQKPPGVIDLKPYFRRSPHARRKKNGGWYMIVPIRRYTPSSRRGMASGMRNQMYNQLRKVSMAPGESSRTIISDYLYADRGGRSPIKELNYTPLSKNITKVENDAFLQQKKSRSYQYVAFRTVSDKSHPSSWLLNRSSATYDDPVVVDVIQKVHEYNNRARRGY